MYYGFHRIPSNDADRDANTALVHRLLGTTEADQRTRKSTFEYKVNLRELVPSFIRHLTIIVNLLSTGRTSR